MTAYWFINADLVTFPDEGICRLLRTIKMKGIATRCDSSDPSFADEAAVRSFVETLETNENDQPMTVEEDLKLLKQAGITNATIFWQEYGEVVYGGCTSGL